MMKKKRNKTSACFVINYSHPLPTSEVTAMEKVWLGVRSQRACSLTTLTPSLSTPSTVTAMLSPLLTGRHTSWVVVRLTMEPAESGSLDLRILMPLLFLSLQAVTFKMLST